MSAQNQGGKAGTPALRRGGAASRPQDRSQLIAPAQAAGRCHVPTTCQTKIFAFHQRPPSGMKERLGPPSGPATIPRSTDPGTPPDLLNLTKGLSMAKTAPVSLQTASKSVPVSDLLQSAQIPQIRPCGTVFQRSYTLCEVYNGNRQFVPVSN